MARGTERALGRARGYNSKPKMVVKAPGDQIKAEAIHKAYFWGC